MNPETEPMTPNEIESRLSLAIQFDSDFWVEYETSFGPMGYFGRDLSLPYPGAVAFHAWETTWRHQIIDISRITRIYTDLEDCPKCGANAGEIDSIPEVDEPWCGTCVREDWEYRDADLLTGDRGL